MTGMWVKEAVKQVVYQPAQSTASKGISLEIAIMVYANHHRTLV